MATDVFVNIKDLPEITEISNGEYVIVETPTGTHIIDFKNFVLPPDNTVITTAVSANANAITNLSTKIDTVSTYAESSVYALSSALVTSYASISTYLVSLSGQVKLLSPLYIGNCTVTINGGGTQATNQGSGVILPQTSRPNISTSDIMVFPVNEYASKNPVFVSSYNTSTGQVTLQGSFLKKTIEFDNTNTDSINKTDLMSALSGKTFEQIIGAMTYTETNSTASENAVYNVLVIKPLV